MIQFLKKLLKKLLEGLRRFFAILFQDDEAHAHTQTSQAALEEKQGVARPVELGLSSSEKPEYRKSKSVLTYRERIFLRTLRRATAGDYTILMKVRMGDFIWLANEPQERKFHNNQTQCKHVDFLLCDKIMVEPLLVVELDDSSHKSYDHAERDQFKNDTFDAVGMPYIRLPVQEQYDAEGLRKQIREKIGERPLVAPEEM
ncbi:MAG: DUF2726 domain-containing protein [Anaerolineales bacterium]